MILLLKLYMSFPMKRLDLCFTTKDYIPQSFSLFFFPPKKKMNLKHELHKCLMDSTVLRHGACLSIFAFKA